ncbi:MAG: hypothetical protein H7144_16670 [Burkholderiales bacterium]|nr:hypothetical protein [Phycisphaerae bacterium]
MLFTTPIWLWLLVPWGMLALWLLFARAQFARVPTTQFWDANDPTQAVRRGIKRPPLAFLLLLLAMLLAILAAAGLGYRDPLRGRRITLIVDRGLATTTALNRDPDKIWEQVRAFASNGVLTPIDLVNVPDRSMKSTDLSDCITDLRSIKPIAIDTAPALHQMVAAELARTDQQILVITGQQLQLADPRVTVIAPQTLIANAGIERFTVSDTEKPKAMIRVWNGTDIRHAVLRVDDVEQSVELPLRGGLQDYFMDLKTLGASVHAQLVVKDDIAADNHAYLVRSGVWPRLEARGALPAGLERMIAVYSRQRAAGGDANKVIITSNPADVPAGVPSSNAPALIVPAGIASVAGRIEVNIDHKLGREVDWDRALINARCTPAVGDGWQSLVRVGDQVLVAVRDRPARQLWVGIDSPEWAMRPDFVVFFTDVFDFLGGTARAYTSEPTRHLSKEWNRTEPVEDGGIECHPGIYRSRESALAMNCPVIHPVPPQAMPSSTSPSGETANAGSGHDRQAFETISLSSPLLLAAMCIMAAAAYRLTRIRSRLG